MPTKTITISLDLATELAGLLNELRYEVLKSPDPDAPQLATLADAWAIVIRREVRRQVREQMAK